jgi:oligopeptide transport system ATP-binding protein
MSVPLLRVRDLSVSFGAHEAVRDVSFELFAGETLGLVGESGSGKSTLARAILGLQKPAQGSVEWQGQNLLAMAPATMRAKRRDLQIVFQDPLASLNPRMTVGDSIAEPLKIFEPQLNGPARRVRIGAMLQRVGLNEQMAGRYPHQFSGGQCQRIGIARAMILQPSLLICDEPVSSLDVSIQGQIINLLMDLQRELGMAMLFISHNLAVVRHLSHRVMVIYRGSVVESAASEAVFSAPIHPYTHALMAAVPRLPGDGQAPVGGAASHAVRSSSAQPDSGCLFRDRCPYTLPVCQSAPPLNQVAVGHWVACHRSHEALNPLFFAS